MDNWGPAMVYLLGYSAHLEQLAGATAARPGCQAAPDRPTPRERLAAGLIALAVRIAPHQLAVSR